jgi:hypothetical protein
MSYGEATYWHNHPDLARLAQNMREQLGTTKHDGVPASPGTARELVDFTTRL